MLSNFEIPWLCDCVIRLIVAMTYVVPIGESRSGRGGGMRGHGGVVQLSHVEGRAWYVCEILGHLYSGCDEGAVHGGRKMAYLEL